MIANMKAQKQERAGGSAVTEPVDVRRQFRQRKVAQGAEPKDAEGGELQRVLGKWSKWPLTLLFLLGGVCAY